jgi:hypothetical protein
MKTYCLHFINIIKKNLAKNICFVKEATESEEAQHYFLFCITYGIIYVYI